MMTKREMCGDSVSLLGFGCMRFPTKDGRIDRERASEMLKYAYERGVNYFDTAVPYHDGESEELVGEFLSGYPRDSFYIATKLPMWAVGSREKAAEIFEGQLKKLKTDYIDFYLFHALSRDRFELIKKLGLYELFDGFKKEGKIRHLGFSFHDSYDVFEDIINYRDWDFCQVQYNYMDTDYQAGRRGVCLCGQRGISVVAMEPIRGGSLIKLRDDIKAVFADHDDRSLAAWALGWVASHPEIKTVLSGMSAMEHVVDNVNTFDDFSVFDASELETVARVAKKVSASRFNTCTKCKYCMPCPAGVDIPANFSVMNEYAMYNNEERARRRYTELEGKAELCVKCGKCETLCPQHILIRDDLDKAVKLFG